MSDGPPSDSVQPIFDRETVGCFRRMVVALAVCGVLLLLLFVAAEFSRGFYGRQAVRRSQCSQHLKLIGIALHQYADTYGVFPPACTLDADGRPLHSWRTLILPYLDQRELYESIDLSKPWDDPVNRAVFDRDVAGFRCPSLVGPKNATRYLAVVDEGTCLQRGVPRKPSEIRDRQNQTLMVIEVTDEFAVPWMSPTDLNRDDCERALQSPFGLHGRGDRTTLWLAVDGSVRSTSRPMPVKTLRALITIAVQETWSPDQ